MGRYGPLMDLTDADVAVAAAAAGADVVARTYGEGQTRFRKSEQGRATLLVLSRLAEQASEALDNASAPLPQELRGAAADLEYAHYANEREEHPSAGRRILGPLLIQLES